MTGTSTPTARTPVRVGHPSVGTPSWPPPTEPLRTTTSSTGSRGHTKHAHTLPLVRRSISAAAATVTFTDGNVRIRTNGDLITFDLTGRDTTTINCTAPVDDSDTELNVGFAGGARHTEGVGNTESIKLSRHGLVEPGRRLQPLECSNGSGDPFTVLNRPRDLRPGLLWQRHPGVRRQLRGHRLDRMGEARRPERPSGRRDIHCRAYIRQNPALGQPHGRRQRRERRRPRPRPDQGLRIVERTTYTSRRQSPRPDSPTTATTRTQQVSTGSPNPVIGTQGVNDAGVTNEPTSTTGSERLSGRSELPRPTRFRAARRFT